VDDISVGSDLTPSGAAEDGIDPDAVARSGDLLRRFAGGYGDRTARAYMADVADFARFLGHEPAAAVASLLAGGPGAGRTVILEYAVGLRRRGAAPATIDRRLSTLRAVVRTALDEDLIDWVLEVPSQVQIAAAMEESSTEAIAPYIFPKHQSEVDRLDVQHYALRETLGGNYLAPVERPGRILDVGCGSGQWGLDLCEQFPTAVIVGFDLVTGKRDNASRHHWIRGNLLQGLPFGDDLFDFVHQRLLLAGVPLVRWPEVVGELVRVTRPGGWVELAEPPFEIEREGPANERLRTLTTELSASLGLDSTRVVFDSVDRYLRDAGVEGVVRREVPVRVGEWGGRVGSLMVTNFRAAYMRLCITLEKRSMITAEEGADLIRRAQNEWEHNRMLWTFAIAYGQKPGAPSAGGRG
jgi:ubiquinone/menaquinone biosynthesis C-methylase UbiE